MCSELSLVDDNDDEKDGKWCSPSSSWSSLQSDWYENLWSEWNEWNSMTILMQRNNWLELLWRTFQFCHSHVILKFLMSSAKVYALIVEWQYASKTWYRCESYVPTLTSGSKKESIFISTSVSGIVYSITNDSRIHIFDESLSQNTVELSYIYLKKRKRGIFLVIFNRRGLL